MVSAQIITIMLLLVSESLVTGMKSRYKYSSRLYTKADSLTENHNGKPLYGNIQHCGLLVSDTIRSIRFYQEAFGMTDETHLRNPKLLYKGGWLRAGASQIHLMELPNPDPVSGRPDHGGRDRHVALTCGTGSLENIKARLRLLDVPFTMSKSGRPALFCRDLDGNALEFMEEEL